MEAISTKRGVLGVVGTALAITLSIRSYGRGHKRGGAEVAVQ
jgi:hypothetical protein